MDCFFCQVETRLQPKYRGKPLAVVQYNKWRSGGIIAVNYEARAFGVTRHMRGKEAKEKCPELLLASVPCLRDKADTSRYRCAGREVIDVISEHCSIIERASVDEAYVDITDLVDKRMTASKIQPRELISKLPTTHVVGFSDDKKNDECSIEDRKDGVTNWIHNIFDELEDTHAQKLAIAGVLVEELRAAIYQKTGFECSAGISQNKVLAKLACGLHKPNRQTILPPTAVSGLYSTLPVKKVRNLGGKFGNIITDSLKCNVMGDLLQYSLQYLQRRFDEKTGLWLYNIARGIDNEPVTTRLIPKSIGACKQFPGKQAIVSLEVLKQWAGDLAAEVCERLEQDLEENQRRATLLTVSYHFSQNGNTVSQSRSCALKSYDPDKMADHCVNIVTKSTKGPITCLGLSTAKFVVAKDNGSITKFFKTVESQARPETKKVEENKAGESSARSETDSLKKLYSQDNYESNAKQDCADCATIIDEVDSKKEFFKRFSKIENDKNVCIAESDALDESPVTMKVNKLIQICNERSKLSKKVKLFNGMVETINGDTDSTDFKQSFFLNVLKDQENSNEATERDSDCKEDHEEEQGSNQPDRLNTCAVKLEEIFPDMNNIDASIIPLLPPQLQEEANLYLKQSKSSKQFKSVGNDGKSVDGSKKNAKAKVSRSKSNSSKSSKSNSISGFLIKASENDSSDKCMKQCLQCGQMIPSAKFDQHHDFHVAQNLYEELNKYGGNEESIKRKNSSSPPDNAAKRRPTTDIIKHPQKSQNIMTFFS